MTPADLRRLREAGWTYREIEALTGVHWSTVRSRCRSLGIEKGPVVHSRNRKRKHETIEKELLEIMYVECQLSTTQIAYELQINRHTLNALLHHHRIPVRSRGEARKVYMKRVDATMPPRPTHTQAVNAGRASGRARRARATVRSKPVA